jgi:hypothetical protein
MNELGRIVLMNCPLYTSNVHMHANNQSNKSNPILSISDILKGNVHLSWKLYWTYSWKIAEVLKY